MKKEKSFSVNNIINDDNSNNNSKVINQPSFEFLNAITNNIGKNSTIDMTRSMNKSNEEDSLLNTSQDEYEENEYFEIVY